MAARPHIYRSHKSDGLTVEIRVFARAGMPTDEVQQRLGEQYASALFYIWDEWSENGTVPADGRR